MNFPTDLNQLKPMLASSPSPNSRSALSVAAVARAPHLSRRFWDSSISLFLMLALSFDSAVPAPLPLLRRLPPLRPDALLLLPKLVATLLKEGLRKEPLKDIGREEAFPLALGVESAVAVEEGASFCGKLDELVLLLLPLEPLNQRLFRALEALDGALLFVSASSPAPSPPVKVAEELPASAALDDGPFSSGAISTSSASRYHLRRRVYRPQPSWRRPSFH